MGGSCNSTPIEGSALTEPTDRRSEPGHLAFKIAYGPGTIGEKREKLTELERQHPGNMGVIGYFEMLRMEEDLEHQLREEPPEGS